MALTDREGIILAINPAHTDLYGFSPDAIVGRHFSIIYPDADRAELAALNCGLFAEPVLPPTFESTIHHRDGGVRETEIRISFIEVDGVRQVMVSAIRDVTDRKQLEHELRQALDEARAATRSKSQFLAMMSHELRTPLQAVLGYTDLLLLGEEDTLAPQQREDLGHIHGGAIRMMTLIDQLLDLSRLEAGRLDVAQELVDLPEVIEQVRQDIAPQAGAKALELSIDLPRVLPPVLGDAGRLRQVLLNLASNAVKFTHQGGVCISAHPSENGVDIAVRDTGIGITAEAMPMIFEEFRQVDGSMTRRYGGAGLGLAIAKRLVEQMGGRITVESQEGLGSAFTVHLGTSPRFPRRRTDRRRRREAAERDA
jgi:PAS domain S-box-containing protein